MSQRLARLALVLPITLAACGGDDDAANDGDCAACDGAPNPDSMPDPGPDAAVFDCVQKSGTNLALELVTGNLEEPVFVTSPPGDPRLFVIEKHGAIRIVEDGVLRADPFLDIDARVQSAPAGNEQGLLGLAFHPDYADNGRFYVFYMAVDSDAAGPEAHVVAQFTVSDSDPNLADADSEVRILELADQLDRANHNGGMIAFGQDSYLYIGLGDGGSGGDPDDNGQNKSTLLGDILRIDVDSGSPYGIPAGNPYKDTAGSEREEIWLSGVRNPWRWSFDRETGDMYIADVGQDFWEEVSVVTPEDQPGANLGWDQVEGMHCFDEENPSCTLGNYHAPVVEYYHDSERSITGGYVYRGTCFPDLVGTYFYADYVTSDVFSFKYVNGNATDQANVTSDLDPDGLLNGVSSFGQDIFGEVYVISLRPGTFGVADGALYRIIVE